jgi:hypothetical protein
MDSSVSWFTHISSTTTQALTSLWSNNTDLESQKREAPPQRAMIFTSILDRIIYSIEDILD